MLITLKLGTIDLAVRSPASVANAVQDDKVSRQIQFSLNENGSPWTIPADSSLVLSYIKPDGKGGMYDTLPDGSPAFTIDGNQVTVILAPQVCTVPGLVKMTVGFLQGQTSLYSFVIDLVVQANPGSVAASEDFYKLSGVIAATGWEPNKYLGTDANGNVVAKAGNGGGSGGSGENGATFIPAISDSGVISWTNDKGLDNPAPVDLVSKVVAALPVYRGEAADA